MKNIFGAIILCGFIFSTASNSTAAIVTVNFDSGSYTLFNTNKTTPLTGGTTADGNGAVIQLGYYSNATSATPFSGTWIPLTGQGGANSAFATTSIGDSNAAGAGNGSFAISVNFDTTIAGKSANLPATAGIPLGIRVYNNTTVAGSTALITISSSAPNWQWSPPLDPPLSPSLNLSLDDPSITLRIDNGTPTGSAVGAAPAANTFSTAVPEPSALLLQGFAAISALCFRNRGRRRI